MASKSLLFYFFIFLYFSVSISFCLTPTSNTNCPTFLFPNNVSVNYPFTLKRKDYTPQCQRFGFEISNKTNTPTLFLPSWGEFVVFDINYWRQAIYLLDSSTCLPERMLNFSLSNSPFHAARLWNYGMFNCTNNSSHHNLATCMSGFNYSVIFLDLSFNSKLTSCNLIWEKFIPMLLDLYFNKSGDTLVELNWGSTSCKNCDENGEDCIPATRPSINAQCLAGDSAVKRGLPIGAKISIPVTIVTIFLAAAYAERKWRERST